MTTMVRGIMPGRGRGRPASILLLSLLLFFSLVQTPGFLVRSNPSIITVPGNYPTIQQAVDAALPGDTILVSPSPTGSYSGNITVAKSLNITGTSANSVIIDGGGNTVGIFVNMTSNVNISGFTIRNDGGSSSVLVWFSSGVTVSGNRLQPGSQGNGTFIYSSSGTVLKSNNITGSRYAAAVSLGYGNLIAGNNMTNNSLGVSILHSQGNKIVDNVLGKGSVGLELQAGADASIVARNLIANNTSSGLLLRHATGNRITDNTVAFNNALSSTTGILVQNATGNRLYHNNILNNTLQAFTVFPPGDSNLWDNATGIGLKSDPRIMFVNATNNVGETWGFNKTVVYDTNNNGAYDPGEPLIGLVNGTTLGVPPTAGTLLKADPKLKFVDSIGVGTWTRGDPVVYDTNNDGSYESNEPGIAGVGGNFWSGYKGRDNGANGFAGDGIGDTLIPHPCPSGGSPCSVGSPAGVDWHPLMKQWRPSGLSATILQPSPSAPQRGYAPLTVSFSGHASGGVPPYSFVWSFGDNSSSVQQQNTTYTYPVNGNYVATLTVTDSSTLTAYDSVTIIVIAKIVLPMYGSLVIHVVDQSLNPVSPANVTSLSQPSGQAKVRSATNNVGIASFVNLVPGSYTFQATSVGYVPANKTFVVLFNQTVNENMVLTRPAPPQTGLSPYLWAGIGVAVAALLAGLGFFLWRRKKTRGPAGNRPAAKSTAKT